MNANVNNSANTNNSNVNAMNANNIEFVCSGCGSKHIIALPKGATPDCGHLTEKVRSVLSDNAIMAVILRHMDELPREVIDKLNDPMRTESLLEVAAAIEEDGYIKSPDIVKRFMVSRTLKFVYEDGNNGICSFLREKGYRYAVKVLHNMLRAMSIMEAKRDVKALEEEGMIWRDEIFVRTMEFWCRELNAVKDVRYYTHSCKHQKYVRIHHNDFNGGKGVFFTEWNELILRYSAMITDFNVCKSYKDKYEVFSRFYAETKKMRWTPNGTPEAFTNAYRAAGGYFTLKDLVLYEGIKIAEDGEDQLQALRNIYIFWCGANGKCVASDGYMMYGALKRILKGSDFDFGAAKRRWYDESQVRKEERRNHQRRSRN